MRNSLRSESPQTATFRLLPKSLAILVALAFLAAACGGTEEVAAGADSDAESEQDLPAETEDSATSVPADDDAAADDTADDQAAGDYQQTTADPEMVSGQPAPIDEVRVVDAQTIGVRYQNGSEPCSLADVTVTESDSEITVALQTGLHQNVAAMSCIAQVLGYEIQIGLDAPIGDRTIVAVEV